MSVHALSADTGSQPFWARFVAADERAELLANPHLLAFIDFDEQGSSESSDPRRIRVGLRQLGASPVAEVWESDAPVESGTRGGVAYAMNDRVLVGHVAVDDRGFPSLEAATREAYEAFLPVAGELGYPHYLRMWNYIPDINGPELDADGHATERYKSFCVGRHAAFAGFSMPERRLPAASAVGSPAGALLVYFLAAREPGHQVENPRQVSAFHYPRRYGPRSPAFSRAMVKDWGTSKHLYISGTASIVGHASRHGDRVHAQTLESLRNVGALMRNADTEHGTGARNPNQLTQIKVYVRDSGDLGEIRDCVEREIDDPRRVLYLAGDLCRTDLLVEMEGLYIG